MDLPGTSSENPTQTTLAALSNTTDATGEESGNYVYFRETRMNMIYLL